MSSREAKAVVLFSAGMDSTVNLFAAQAQAQVVLALTFDYGQRAAHKEISCAKRICEKLHVPHQTVELPFIKSFGKSSLIDSNQSVPTGSQISLDDHQTSAETAKSVWVANRNGIFLNVAAGFAESLGADWIVPGFNKEEAETFPDNSEEFLQITTRALSFSTANKVQVKCFTTHKNKTEIVQMGEKWKIDWSLIWPCYLDGEKWCGQCESCQRSKRALMASGMRIFP